MRPTDPSVGSMTVHRPLAGSQLTMYGLILGRSYAHVAARMRSPVRVSHISGPVGGID